jgi:D-ribose pyranose/furanose isomerase RbsD
MKKKQPVVEVITKEVDLETVIEATERSIKTPKCLPVPSGYKRLDAGVKRMIRVNKDWIAQHWSADDRRFIIRVGDRDSFYEDVIITGACSMQYAENSAGSGCGRTVTRSAWVETESELHVKDAK